MKLRLLSSRLLICASASAALYLSGCNKEGATHAATTPAADNSAKNVRDREDTLTPGDQGNSPADREITQNIRKAVTASSNGYSMTAKNIKIITVNGKVTLRGPVKSDAEKMGIHALAAGIAGEGNLQDMLEVKTNP